MDGFVRPILFNRERLPHCSEVGKFVSAELPPNFFKCFHDIFRIEPFAAMEADLSINFDGNGIASTSEQFFHLFVF